MEMCVCTVEYKNEAPGEIRVRSWSNEPFRLHQLSYEWYESFYTKTEPGSLLFSKNKVHFFSVTR
jgi:hypothetical protein